MPNPRNANLPGGQKGLMFLLLVLLFAGIGCLYAGIRNLRLAERTKPTIHVLTAAELIA